MAKKNTPVDPLVASLMPESDKKMGAIAGGSVLVALALSFWASMYEAVVDEVIFDTSEGPDLTASMSMDEKKEEKKEEKKKEEPKKPRKKAGGGGKPRGKGQPNAPQTRGVLKLLTAQTKTASAAAYDLMKNQKFTKDIDKVLKDVAGLQTTGKTKVMPKVAPVVSATALQASSVAAVAVSLLRPRVTSRPRLLVISTWVPVADPVPLRTS